MATANWSDKCVGISDPDTGKEVRSPLRHPDQLYSVAYSPDGRRLAAADGQSQVIVWDPDAGKPLFTLKGTGKEFSTVCWIPDGRRLATSASDHAILLWDGHTGQKLGKLQGHTAPVSSLRWSPDGRKLASAAQDRTLKIWDMTTNSEIRTVPDIQIDRFAGAICLSPDSRRLAGGCRDLAVRVWDAESWDVLHTYWGHTGSHISTVCWSPDGTRLASADRGWNGEIKIWKLDAEPEPRTLAAANEVEPKLEVCWSADGRRLATAHKDGTVKIWDAATGRMLTTLYGHVGPVQRVRWSPVGGKLASGSGATMVKPGGAETGQPTMVKLWDVQTGQLLGSFAGSGHSVTSLTWSPDGKQLAWNADNDTVTLIEVATRTQRRASILGQGAAWSPKDDRLSVGEHYKVRIHDAGTGTLLGSWATSVDRNEQVFWSPDGLRIASVADYTVDVRDVATGHAPFSPLAHTQRVVSVGWSPDSKQLATATEDHRVHLWDAATGNVILSLREQAGSILSVAWSPDGTRLAFASSEGTLHIWDATPGYVAERAAALLPSLDARIAADSGDREALRLRAGVHAHRGNCNRAAADAEQLLSLASQSGPRCFQAGWWIADDLEPASSAPSPRYQDPFAIGLDRAPPSHWAATPHSRPQWVSMAWTDWSCSR